MCRCDAAYPAAAAGAGGTAGSALRRRRARAARKAAGEDPVAIVGARRRRHTGWTSPARSGAVSAVAGLTVVSGMAHGIDSAAHAGALERRRPTVAVLPGAADRPYPAGKRALHRRICRRRRRGVRARAGDQRAAVDVSGSQPHHRGAGGDDRSWSRPASARGRWSRRGFAPESRATGRGGTRAGHVAAGGGAERLLLAAGACVVRGPQDVLDHLFGAGNARVRPARTGRSGAGAAPASGRDRRRARHRRRPGAGGLSGAAGPGRTRFTRVGRRRPTGHGREVLGDALSRSGARRPSCAAWPGGVVEKQPGFSPRFSLLLCQGGCWVGAGGHGVVDGAYEVAFEAAEGFGFGFALGEPAVDVVASGGMGA